ncbi:hypothetical protein RPALISO_144 [Ruegeria phage RpAliso]|nr:hypothetical protein RPALISO_144 [Ruegeria phage RpAliso]
MKLMTKEIEKRLLANAKRTAEAQSAGKPEPDHKPVVKIFAPWGAATWLLTEMDEEGIAFGLCDLGMGSPEIGAVALSELSQTFNIPMQINGRPAGSRALKLERDLYFKADKTLYEYAAAARTKGRIDA